MSVDLSITFTEQDGGTRIDAAFDARPHGLFKLVFPIFIRMMKKEEAANGRYLKQYLEGRDNDATSAADQ